MGPLRGRAAVRAARVKGAGYLRRLLARPGRPLSACELAVPRPPAGGDLGPAADCPALEACRALAAELAEEIRDARRQERPVEGLVGELGRVEAYVRSSCGRGGKVRAAGDPREKVRKAVGAALTRAVADLAVHSPAFGAHLDGALRKGRKVGYDPPEPRPWTTE